MKITWLIYLFFCLLSVTSSAALAQSLSIEALNTQTRFGNTLAKQVKLSPLNDRIFYLEADPQTPHQYDLWQMLFEGSKKQRLVNSASVLSKMSQPNVSAHDKQNKVALTTTGISSYQLSHDGQALTYTLNGQVYYFVLDNYKNQKITNRQSPASDIKFSPDDRYLSFIRDRNIYIAELPSGNITQLTHDTDQHINNGVAGLIAQEEMLRTTGYWWAPNSQYIAFSRINDSELFNANSNSFVINSAQQTTKPYPFAGEKNVRVQLAYLELNKKRKDSKIRYIDLGEDNDIYLGAVTWHPNSKQLLYQIQSRDQQNVFLNSYTLKKNKTRLLLREQDPLWLDTSTHLFFLANGDFIWSSKRSGFKHLYRYNSKGELIKPLTQGNWTVDDIVGIDEKANWLYFTGRADTPLEKHLYKVPLNSKVPVHVARVSTRNGFHDISFSSDYQFYLDCFSNIATPEQISIHHASGQHFLWVEENALNTTALLSPELKSLITPEFGSIMANDGKTELFYNIYNPKKIEPGEQYAAIILVNGAPKSQSVLNKWQYNDVIQRLTQQGYIVFQLDNRGTASRGKAFEQVLTEQLGQIEVQDQVSGVHYLQTLPYINQQQIALYGNDYGGYLALMAMAKESELFATAIVGSPITDWAFYNTYFSERYLGLPEQASSNYKESSALTHVSAIDKPFLLYHGMADDQIFFTHSEKLMKALQDNNTFFELMTYPGVKKVPQNNKAKPHLHRVVLNNLARYLRPTQ